MEPPPEDLPGTWGEEGEGCIPTAPPKFEEDKEGGRAPSQEPLLPATLWGRPPPEIPECMGA